MGITERHVGKNKQYKKVYISEVKDGLFWWDTWPYRDIFVNGFQGRRTIFSLVQPRLNYGAQKLPENISEEFRNFYIIAMRYAP